MCYELCIGVFIVVRTKKQCGTVLASHPCTFIIYLAFIKAMSCTRFFKLPVHV